MLTFVICVCILSMATDVTHGRFVDLPQLPDGITVHNVLQIWDEAEESCRSEGAILASPINENVFNAMKSLINATRSTFYIGAKASQHPGRYVSLEGIPLENMTIAWHELDPTNGDCLAITNRHLRVVPCETRLPYMCIKPDIFNKIKIETNMPCDEGYTYQKILQHCYKLHGETVIWRQAQTTCIAEGGNLAILDNSLKAQLITNMYDFNAYKWVFIGIQEQTADAGHMKWIDGRPVEFQFDMLRIHKKPNGDEPYDDEPSDPSHTPFICGTINDDGYLDVVHCASKLPFVCEKEPTV